MKIHSDILRLSDLQSALETTGLADTGVYLDSDRPAAERGSRSHARSMDFYLIASKGHGRRWANSGTRGAGCEKAATYDEWGTFLAELFDRDSAAKATYYDGRRDFESKTGKTVSEWLAVVHPS